MTHSIRTVLWFNRHGREAAEFYCSLIPNRRLETSYSSNNGGSEGNAFFELIDFTLNGVPYQILDAGPMFPLSQCVSVSVLTPDQAESDRLWEALAAGGGRHGPCRLAEGPFWLVLAGGAAVIVYDLMTAPDTARAGQALAAVMQMGKIDIATVTAAAQVV